jgi:hypothetical protein
MSAPKTILICILCGGERNQWISPWIYYASLAWTQDKRFRLRFVPCFGAQNHEAARNWCTEECIRGGDQFLMMIDNDTRTSQGNTLVNLIDLATLDLDIVGAPVPVLKKDGVYLNAYMHQEGVTFASSTIEALHEAMEKTNGVLERDALGSAVICIKREVLLAMRESNWMPDYLQDIVRWPAEPPYPAWVLPRDCVGNHLQGEDLLFCWRAKHLGFRVFTSLKHLCGHDHTIDQRDIPDVKPMMGLRVEETQTDTTKQVHILRDERSAAEAA